MMTGIQRLDSGCARTTIQVHMDTGKTLHQQFVPKSANVNTKRMVTYKDTIPDKEYEVSRIRGHHQPKEQGAEMEFLCCYKGYSMEDSQWVKKSELERGSPVVLKTYRDYIDQLDDYRVVDYVLSPLDLLTTLNTTLSFCSELN